MGEPRGRVSGEPTGVLARMTRRFREALHLDDPPWRLALSLAVGVFISFTPLYGLQTLLAIGLAVVCRLNRAATVAGTWLNLPWFAPVVYAGALRLGTLVIPDPAGVRSAWLEYILTQPGSLSWRDLPAVLDSMSLPLLVGTSMLGSVAGLVTYVVSFRLISRRRAAQHSRPLGRRSPGMIDRGGRDRPRAQPSPKEPGA